MATGYTYMLQEKPDLPLKDFVLRCARAMSPCVEQRDDPSDRLPELRRPDRYHIDRLEELQSELAWWNEASDAEVFAKLQLKTGEVRQESLMAVEKKKSVETNYRRMLAMVESWEPPTLDHQPLKEFMIQQITESIDHDCDVSYYERRCEVPVVTAAEFRQTHITDIEEDIARHKESHEAEVKQTNWDNEWKRQLFQSLDRSH